MGWYFEFCIWYQVASIMTFGLCFVSSEQTHNNQTFEQPNNQTKIVLGIWY